MYHLHPSTNFRFYLKHEAIYSSVITSIPHRWSRPAASAAACASGSAGPSRSGSCSACLDWNTVLSLITTRRSRRSPRAPARINTTPLRYKRFFRHYRLAFQRGRDSRLARVCGSTFPRDVFADGSSTCVDLWKRKWERDVLVILRDNVRWWGGKIIHLED